MRILVTGADGFLGEHLLRTLLGAGHEVVGGILGDAPELRTLDPAEASRVEWRSFDLRDPASVTALIAGTVPDATVHLAGLTSVHASWREPERVVETNALGALRLINALRELPARSDVRRTVVLAGSAEAYGAEGTEAQPLTEDRPLQPLNPYGASKAAQEMIGWALGRAPWLRLIQVRTFQLAGPGQRPTFALPDWARQLVEIRAGRRPPVLSVGNLAPVRDFLDVRDAAAAYHALLETPGAEGAFNLCSRKGYSLRELLERLQRIVGVWPEVRVDAARMRPADVGSLVGSPARLIAATGWRPERSIQQALEDLVAEVERLAGPADPPTAPARGRNGNGV